MNTLAMVVMLTVAAEPDALQLARGKTLFAQRCAVCHGESGKGDGVTAAALAPPPADFSAARYAPAFVSQVLWDGVPGTSMPAQRDLSAVDRAALVRFVTSLGPSEPPAAKTDVVALGRDVYEIRCASCHGAGGDGSGVSRTRFARPPADFTRKQPTQARIDKVLVDGIKGTAMTPMRRLLSDRERDAVVAYLQSVFGAEAAAGVPPR